MAGEVMRTFFREGKMMLTVASEANTRSGSALDYQTAFQTAFNSTERPLMDFNG